MLGASSSNRRTGRFQKGRRNSIFELNPLNPIICHFQLCFKHQDHKNVALHATFQQLLLITSCTTNNIFDHAEVFIESSIFHNKMYIQHFLLAGSHHLPALNIYFTPLPLQTQWYHTVLLGLLCRWVAARSWKRYGLGCSAQGRPTGKPLCALILTWSH